MSPATNDTSRGGAPSRAAIIVAGLLLLLAGAPAARAEEPQASAYEEGTVTGGGTLIGTVKGPAPAVPFSDAIVTKDKGVCGERKPSEAIVRAADGGLKNAVVFFQGISRGKPIDRSRPVKFDNHGCRFEPHVVAVAVGQRLEISNSDPVLHNTHAYLDGSQTIFNVALPVQNQRIPKTMKKPGLMSVKCDAGHNWMLAWIYAFDHPYFAVTGEKGEFRIDQVPPGTYKVTAWHEELGTETREVTIEAGQEAKLTFEHLAK